MKTGPFYFFRHFKTKFPKRFYNLYLWWCLQHRGLRFDSQGMQLLIYIKYDVICFAWKNLLNARLNISVMADNESRLRGGKRIFLMNVYEVKHVMNNCCMYWVSFDVMLRSTNCKWSDVNLSTAGSWCTNTHSCCLCSLCFSTEQRRLHVPSTNIGFKNKVLALRQRNALLYFQRITPHCPESTAARNWARGEPTDQTCSILSIPYSNMHLMRCSISAFDKNLL